MELEETDIYEALGVEPPEEEPEGPEGTPADGAPPEEGENTGENPKESGENSGTPEGNPEPEETPAPMSDEERHRQATLRRDAERAEQERSMAAAVDQAYATAYAGRLNPYTKRPITSKADYEEYQTQYAADQQRRQMDNLRAAGVDPDAIQAMIDQHPAIQQAQQVIRAAEAERERAQAAQAKGWYGEQIKQINSLDPEAKLGSLEDLAAKEPEQYTKMLGMVTRGVSFVDAYKMLHFDDLTQRRAAAAQQAVRNQAAGKAHLTPSGGQGKAGIEVPADIREEFRALMPGITDAEIARQYGDYLNKSK
jgi:hypothetical protein